jgi:hypothetical protein
MDDVVDMTKPNPAWDADQIHVYRERLAISGENKTGNTHAECVCAYRQAEAWKQTEQEGTQE